MSRWNESTFYGTVNDNPIEIVNTLLNNETTLKELQTLDFFYEYATLIDSLVWQKCKDDPQRYLDIYHDDGKNSKDAKQELDKRAVEIEKEKAQAEAEAKAKEDEDAWKAACELNTYSAYKDYKEKYTKYADKAEKRINEILEKDRIRQEKERLAKEAIEAEDELWNDVCKKNTIPAYDGYLSIYEKTGRYVVDAQNRKRQILDAQEDEKWNDALEMDTLASYQFYLDCYPKGRYANTARNKQDEKRREKKRNMVAELEKDPNAYDLDKIKEVLKASDLHGKIKDSKGQVHNELLDRWNALGEELELGNAPRKIPDGDEGSTEVYFWGIPGSGKTCAMAAILSQAKIKGYYEPLSGEGLRYMTQLSRVFFHEGIPVSILPERTTTETTQYLPFVLNETVRTGIFGRNEQIRPHKISIIELSGEIFECFEKKLQNEPFPTEGHTKTFNQLNDYLKGSNPKYHFFVLDSKPNRQQLDALQHATLYFNQNNLFNEKTQGISIIVTKCDTLTKSKDLDVMQQSAKDYADKTFAAFIRTLKGIASRLGITNGNIPIHPLSIGEVFFQRMCLFDGGSAQGLVQTLMAYAKTDEIENRLNFFNN